MYRYSQQPLSHRKTRKSARSTKTRRYATSIKKAKPKQRKPFIIPWKLGAGILTLLLLVAAVHFGSLMLSLITLVRDINKSSIMDQGRVNIVLNNNGLKIASFDTVNNNLTVFTIPNNVYVTTNDGNKTKLGAVYTIAELNKKGSGEVALNQTIQDTFGIFIDGYIGFPSHANLGTSHSIQEEFGSWQFLYDVFNNDGEERDMATTLTKTDFLKLWWHVHTMRFDKITVNDLSQTDAMMPDELADGTKVLGVSTSGIDAAMSDSTKDYAIAQEGAAVTVVNASGIAGQAEQFARLLTNLGAHVIAVRSADTPVPQSTIAVINPNNAKVLLKRLSKLPNFTIINAQKDDSQLGDITITIGAQ